MIIIIVEYLYVISFYKENIFSIILCKKDIEMNYFIKVNEDQIFDIRYYDLKFEFVIVFSFNLLKKNIVVLSREKGFFFEEKDKVVRFFYKNKLEKDFISIVKYDSYLRIE